MFFLQNIIKVAKNDFIKVFTNYALLIVVIALSILPSLYAWINIKASWDPYSQEATSRLKVAVVNMDEGIVFNNSNINIGNKLIDELKSNRALGWEFLSKLESQEKLKYGKIYASIEIPNNFSKDLLSFTTNDIVKPELIYTVNEKLNAIAPKITSKGADTIQNSINEEIIKTISALLLNIAKDAGINIEENIMPKLLYISKLLHDVQGSYFALYQDAISAQDKVESIENFIDVISSNIPKIEEILNDADNITDRLDNYMITMQGGLNGVIPLMIRDIRIINSISESLVNIIGQLNNSELSPQEISDFISNIKDSLKSIDKIINSAASILDSINNLIPNDNLTEVVNSIMEKSKIINDIYDKLNIILENGIADNDMINNLFESIIDVNNFFSYLNNNFDSKISPEINSILSDSIKNLININKIIKEARKDVPSITSTISNVDDLFKIGSYGTEKLIEVLPTIKEKIDDITLKVDNINSNKNIIDLIDLVKSNVSERIDYLENPVNMKNITIYPMGTYGSQMSPFYSVLASWVGLTLLVSILKINASKTLKSYEVYFGKMSLFMIIAILQGLIIALGDLYLLKINCKFPLLFIMSIIFISIVFTFIVYTLVSVFGNVGKVIAIIFMILQVAGSGGTFPIQLTSPFFINLNPYLPFTYAISMLRESIGGVVKNIFLADIFYMVIFCIVSLIIGIFFKRYINKLMKSFSEKLEETNLV